MSSNALSERISQIKPSATMAVSAKANELRSQGHDVINLSVGEPDFDTPDFIKAAAIEAINSGFTKYTAADGIAELKTAIINKLKDENQLSYEPNQVIVINGVKQGIYNLAQAILNEGDEAIIPAPYWVSYPAITKLAGATPVIIETDASQRFKITAEQLANAITPKTRLVFLNSPSNPTGMAYTADELKALGEVLKKHPNITIATDDIYEYILWGMDEFVSLLNVCPELKDQTIVFNGVSKSHAMTGWRIGYAAGPQAIIAAMKKVSSQSTSSPCSISQKAAVAALNARKNDFFMPMLAAFKERHDMVYAALNAMDDVSCLASDGTFYILINVEKVIKRLNVADDIALAEYILDESKVAMVPGTPFGAPGHMRISCATSDTALQTAIERLSKIFNAQ